MDKNTGRSKGYGFVTFRDPEAARRACVDPTPVIDGRRANCNLASLDALPNPDRLNTFRKVGVIGGGAFGLVAARELKRHGFQVIVYKRNHDVGGVWLYDPHVEDDDPLGLNPNRQIVSSSLYASLRTNLPRDVMGFMDYPFIVKDGRDHRRFPGHQEMQLYLRDFATDFNLLELIGICPRKCLQLIRAVAGANTEVEAGKTLLIPTG